MTRNVLVLAPHTDDAELGCGGTISRFIREAYNVTCVAFSTCVESLPKNYPRNTLEKEFREATGVLRIPEENLIIKRYRVRKFPQYRQDILEDMIVLVRQIQPDLVFMPSSHDIHQDHKVIFEEGLRAFKRTSILGYEFMWNNLSFNPSTYIRLTEHDISKKIDSVKKYESQSGRFYSIDQIIRGLANYRGVQIGTEYAESFETIRWIV